MSHRDSSSSCPTHTLSPLFTLNSPRTQSRGFGTILYRLSSLKMGLLWHRSDFLNFIFSLYWPKSKIFLVRVKLLTKPPFVWSILRFVKSLIYLYLTWSLLYHLYLFVVVLNHRFTEGWKAVPDNYLKWFYNSFVRWKCSW